MLRYFQFHPELLAHRPSPCRLAGSDHAALIGTRNRNRRAATIMHYMKDRKGGLRRAGVSVSREVIGGRPLSCVCQIVS